MQIRRIQPSDIPAFHALWTRTYSEGIYIPNPPPPQDRILEVVQKVVAEQIPNFVALNGEALLGFVEVFPGTMCGRTGENAKEMPNGARVKYKVMTVELPGHWA
ncbi:MAG: hypothetical protein WBJ75_04505 [Pseudohongiellaceae bacterium]